MIPDKMRAEFEASIDAADELAKQWYGVLGRKGSDESSLYYFDIRDADAPRWSLVAQGDVHTHLVEATANNWRIVDEATGGTYIRAPLTYACEDLNAAIVRGGFQPHKDMWNAHMVVDGQLYQISDIPREAFEEQIMKVAKRQEHAGEAEVRRFHQMQYVMSHVPENKSREP